MRADLQKFLVAGLLLTQCPAFAQADRVYVWDKGGGHYSSRQNSSKFSFGTSGFGSNGFDSGFISQSGGPARTTAHAAMNAQPGSAVSPGQFNYFNQMGVGYYTPNPDAPAFPAYPFPDLSPGNRSGSLSLSAGYWRAPSGYYYPWCPRMYSNSNATDYIRPILLLTEGSTHPASPPFAVALDDLNQFLEEAFPKKRFLPSDYHRLKLRYEALRKTFRDLSQKNEDKLNADDESDLRRQLDSINSEITRMLLD